MKRSLFPGALVMALALPFAVNANAEVDRYEVISAETPHDRLFDVLFKGDKGIAVGEAGLVKITQDGGKTWTRDDAPTQLALLDVASNGTRTIAVGQFGLIMVRDDAGPWREVKSGTDRRLLRVSVNKAGLAFIVGAFGTLLRSTNAGDSWEEAAPDWANLYESGSGSLAVVRDEPTNYIVNVMGDGGVLIGGEYGQIMYSPDGGKCWQIAYRHPSEGSENAPTLFTMSLREDGVGYAVGQAGLIVRTENHGQSWTALDSGIGAGLFGVDSTKDGHVAVVGQRAALHSSDGGQTWQKIEALDLTLNWYASVGRADSTKAGEFLAVGHSGRIIRLGP